MDIPPPPIYTLLENNQHEIRMVTKVLDQNVQISNAVLNNDGVYILDINNPGVIGGPWTTINETWKRKVNVIPYGGKSRKSKRRKSRRSKSRKRHKNRK